jgi:uncharacterized protein (DUF1330 family)
MKANYRLALALLAGTAIGAAAITALKAQARPPTYVVIEVSEMLDAAAFEKAVAGAPLLDGHYMVRTQKVTARDGDAPPIRFVVIAFDTEEKFKAWSDSPAIKEVNAVRLKTTKSRSFVVEGMPN